MLHRVSAPLVSVQCLRLAHEAFTVEPGVKTPRVVATALPADIDAVLLPAFQLTYQNGTFDTRKRTQIVRCARTNRIPPKRHWNFQVTNPHFYTTPICKQPRTPNRFLDRSLYNSRLLYFVRFCNPQFTSFLQNQYVFCYETIQKCVDSFSDYANFSDAWSRLGVHALPVRRSFSRVTCSSALAPWQMVNCWSDPGWGVGLSLLTSAGKVSPGTSMATCPHLRQIYQTRW